MSPFGNPIVVAGTAATLQLIRWSMDLVVRASKATGEKKQKKKKTGTLLENDNKGPAYGSVPTTDSSSSSSDEESKHEATEEQEEVLTFIELYLAKISLGIQLALCIYFSIIFFQHDKDVWTMIASVSFFLGTLLVAFDLQRQRFGFVQRSFHTLVAITVWAASLHSKEYVWKLPTILFLYIIFTLVEAQFTRTPSASKRPSGKPLLSGRAILTLLKPYFWPDATDSSAIVNRIRAMLTWVCVILSKVANLVSPIFLGWASTAITRQDYTSAIKYSVTYCVIGFVGSTLKEFQSLIYLKVAQAAFVQLSEVAFAHIHSLSLDWHLRKKLGEVLRSMDRGIAACDTLMKYLFLWLIPALAEAAAVCIIFATYFDYWPMAVVVFYFVFLYIVWTILVTLWRKKYRKAVVESDNEWHDISTDSLINFETVKYFTAESYELKRFGDAVKRYQSGSVQVQASLSLLNISQKLILQCCLATALSMAAMGIKQKWDCCESNGCAYGNSDCCSNHPTCTGMEVGDFVAVLTYTIQLFGPLNFLGSVYNAVVMAIIDLSNLSELLAENPDVVDAPDAFTLPRSNEKDPDVAVEFDNVFFHYPTQPSNKGLKGLSFKMKRGTTTAIVGPTGAGKTTVSRLLFRFYDVLGGAVKVNGVDVRSVTQTSLRGAMGVVPQSTSMFNDTLRHNIAYGHRNATQDELDQAADDAQLTTFIKSLDDGWESMVGDRGLKLSGGEKQRTAIARCLLKDPPFVLLDEATSALDTITEASVQDALDRLGKERTVLVIAHRLGTIRNADNIIVLKEGVVHEQGTHDELLAMNGQYSEMWK
jgi:ABC-type transport system involved in Fe-S cluster assembly fused permease/ATPase subunit